MLHPCGEESLQTPNVVKSPAGSLSFVIGLDADSSELFEFTCNLGRRGKDKLYLAHCTGPMGVHRKASRDEDNIITKFKERAIANGFVAVGRSLDGKPSLELPKFQSQVQGDIIAVSASRDTGEVSKGGRYAERSSRCSGACLQAKTYKLY